MNANEIAVIALLWIGVAACVISVIGMLLMRSLFTKLHYMGSVAGVGAGALLVAVLLAEGWNQAGIKAALACLVGLVMNAVLTHATARAARVRALGDWAPRPEERIEGAYGRRQTGERRRRSNE